MIKNEKFTFIFNEKACKRCEGLCCKGSGYVFLNKEDIVRISNYLNLEPYDFLDLYTKKVNYGKLTALKSLKIKSEERCVFLDDKNRCEIYDVRPKQCVDFPFWDNVKEKIDYKCPGIIQCEDR